MAKVIAFTHPLGLLIDSMNVQALVLDLSEDADVEQLREHLASEGHQVVNVLDEQALTTLLLQVRGG